MEYVITFKNTNQAVKAEKLLLERNVHVAVMAVPSQIGAGCGICARINEGDVTLALKILRESKIDETELYKRESSKGKYVYTNVGSALSNDGLNRT